MTSPPPAATYLLSCAAAASSLAKEAGLHLSVPHNRVAAGSTIVDDVPAGALAVARGHEHISTDWVHRKRAGSAASDAAIDSDGEIHPMVAEARARLREENQEDDQ